MSRFATGVFCRSAVYDVAANRNFRKGQRRVAVSICTCPTYSIVGSQHLGAEQYCRTTETRIGSLVRSFSAPLAYAATCTVGPRFTAYLFTAGRDTPRFFSAWHYTAVNRGPTVCAGWCNYGRVSLTPSGF